MFLFSTVLSVQTFPGRIDLDPILEPFYHGVTSNGMVTLQNTRDNLTSLTKTIYLLYLQVISILHGRWIFHLEKYIINLMEQGQQPSNLLAHL